jgi:hypothetical protein
VTPVNIQPRYAMSTALIAALAKRYPQVFRKIREARMTPETESTIKPGDIDTTRPVTLADVEDEKRRRADSRPTTVVDRTSGPITVTVHPPQR